MEELAHEQKRIAANHKDGKDEKADVATRVIADHLRATKKGSKVFIFRQADDILIKKSLYPVKYVKDLDQDLFSITNELSCGARLSRNEKCDISLT